MIETEMGGRGRARKLHKFFFRQWEREGRKERDWGRREGEGLGKDRRGGTGE